MIRFLPHPHGRSVAIIGPDGCGKSTLIRNLERSVVPTPRRIYMGINPASMTHVLPTTRLVWYVKRRLRMPLVNYDQVRLPQPSQSEQPKRFYKRLLRELKSTAFVVNRIAEEWYRQSVSWVYQWRGDLVLYDRHFYLDYLANRVSDGAANRSAAAWRVHDFLIEHLFPRPHLTLYLDAPPEILFARKQEVTIERLERMHQAYNHISRHVTGIKVIDSSMSVDEILDAATAAISELTR